MTKAGSRLESAINERWYAESPGWLWLLWPFELLYAGITALRRALYRQAWLKSESLPVPVVVVGNIVAGGSGKTPVTIALARMLVRAGYRPGIVSRGYGRQSREQHVVGSNSTPQDAGDEPLLLFREAQVPVVVGRDRVAAAKEAIRQGCDLILADDGLQHYRLARDVEVAIIPGQRGHGNGHLLPLGPLREPVRRLKRAQFQIVVNGRAPDGAFQVQGEIGLLNALDRQCRDDEATISLWDLRGQKVLAIAAIAHPEMFFKALRVAGLKTEERRFPDHHRFSEGDFDKADDRPIVMTTKDAVKCGFLSGRKAYALEYTVSIPEEFQRQLLHTIADCADSRSRKSNINPKNYD